jgi:hypothetical protein
VYRILGLEPGLVFHRLHERSVGGAPALPHPLPAMRRGDHSRADDDKPVVVRGADAAPSGYALPWADATAPEAGERAPFAGVQLDRATIARKIAESRAASMLLTAIFDTDQTTDIHPAHGDGADRVAGLDQAHSALLRALAARPSWTWAAFRSLAAAHGVLPDGAFDLLNEVAIDAAGAPVIEDGDTLAVDNDVLLELLA